MWDYHQWLFKNVFSTFKYVTKNHCRVVKENQNSLLFIFVVQIWFSIVIVAWKNYSLKYCFLLVPLELHVINIYYFYQRLMCQYM